MKQKVLLPPITKGSCWPPSNLNFTYNSPRWSSGDSPGCRNCLDTNTLESIFIGTKQKTCQSELDRYCKWRFRLVSCQIYPESCGKVGSLSYRVTCHGFCAPRHSKDFHSHSLHQHLSAGRRGPCVFHFKANTSVGRISFHTCKKKKSSNSKALFL